MRDKATQTPRAWADERRRGSHKRSASCGSTDQLKEIAKLRQQLQRSKRSSRHRRDKERKSPFNGSHAIMQSQAPMPKTILIPIPISKSSAPRFRNSVEGLNQEIERIIIRDTPEKDEPIVPQDVPDGHRAPPPVPPQRSSSTRSIDTQTPSGGGLSGSHSNGSSRPDSISPSYLTVLADAVAGGSPLDDKELGPCSPLPKYAASPRPNNSYTFKREPPEGCEKVKVSEESLKRYEPNAADHQNRRQLDASPLFFLQLEPPEASDEVEAFMKTFNKKQSTLAQDLQASHRKPNEMLMFFVNSEKQPHPVIKVCVLPCYCILFSFIN
ncbi:protein FAM117B isoform X1 [Syngnathoides biaculeatus]|uniref:protein FAM117B isoform X1 n=1 Tax=Syngnathoides biaculeatus TaxID=300417 RepID=UPI002ADD45E6|nr:protein FAM117B isoform X1 [Syngnathoides biaculeatus]